jgi:protein-tyrosine phosphatase
LGETVGVKKTKHTDLHLHLLPDLDDGARDEATALTHAEKMVAAGIETATVTPHIGAPYFDVAASEVSDRTRALQEALDRSAIPLRLRTGGELHPLAAANLTDAELDLVAQGPAGRRWVLAEIPFAGVDDNYSETIRSIGRRGFGVVIAHPERARGVVDGDGMQKLLSLLLEGAVFQVNAGSLLGHHGQDAREVARRMIRSRSAYVISSDGHPGTRDQLVTDAYDPALELGASIAQVERMLSSNPRLLLRDGLKPIGQVHHQPGERMLAELGLAT